MRSTTLSKERVVFRESTEDVFAVDIYIEAGGNPQAPAHVHPLRDERARLVSGSARLILDGEERIVAAAMSDHSGWHVPCVEKRGRRRVSPRRRVPPWDRIGGDLLAYLLGVGRGREAQAERPTAAHRLGVPPGLGGPVRQDARLHRARQAATAGSACPGQSARANCQAARPSRPIAFP